MSAQHVKNASLSHIETIIMKELKVCSMIDKKINKQIDNIVSEMRIAIYKSSLNITEEIHREIEERLVKAIQDRWEYIDKQKEK